MTVWFIPRAKHVHQNKFLVLGHPNNTLVDHYYVYDLKLPLPFKSNEGEQINGIEACCGIEYGVYAKSSFVIKCDVI